MIIVMNTNAKMEDANKVSKCVESLGLRTNISKGDSHLIVGVMGDTSVLDPNKLLRFDGVEKIVKVQEPFKKANRAFHPDDSIFEIAGRNRCFLV